MNVLFLRRSLVGTLCPAHVRDRARRGLGVPFSSFELRFPMIVVLAVGLVLATLVTIVTCVAAPTIVLASPSATATTFAIRNMPVIKVAVLLLMVEVVGATIVFSGLHFCSSPFFDFTSRVAWEASALSLGSIVGTTLVGIVNLTMIALVLTILSGLSDLPMTIIVAAPTPLTLLLAIFVAAILQSSSAVPSLNTAIAIKLMLVRLVLGLKPIIFPACPIMQLAVRHRAFVPAVALAVPLMRLLRLLESIFVLEMTSLVVHSFVLVVAWS